MGCGLGRWRGRSCADGVLGEWLFGLVGVRVGKKTWLMVRLDDHGCVDKLKVTRAKRGSYIISIKVSPGCSYCCSELQM